MMKAKNFGLIMKLTLFRFDLKSVTCAVIYRFLSSETAPTQHWGRLPKV